MSAEIKSFDLVNCFHGVFIPRTIYQYISGYNTNKLRLQMTTNDLLSFLYIDKL